MSFARHLLAGAAALALTPVAALAADSDGRLILEARTRFETLDIGALDADAWTARLRLGWETPTRANLTGLVEIEAIGALVDDYADGVRANPGRAVIPDPEILELNRAQVTWTPSSAAEVVVGRQRIVLGNARFVGVVGWRQNEQTFDAIKLVGRPGPHATVTYAYIGRVNRPTGRDHPQGVWRGDVHVLQGETKTPVGKLTGYGYLMDFSTVPAQSAATVGLRLVGDRPIGSGVSATWELEYARQSDWGRNPNDFGLDYVLVAGGVKTAASSVGLVYERLDGDGRNGFQTPLGTLHGFQGRSDVIGATPAFGIRDVYLRANTTVTWGRPVRFSGELHDFRDADGDRRLGQELDLAAGISVSKPVAVEVGVARFDSKGPTYPDATRAWLSVEYKY